MAITKYKNHTSINTIENRMVELNYSTFSFDFIYRKVTVKEINKLCILMYTGKYSPQFK